MADVERLPPLGAWEGANLDATARGYRAEGTDAALPQSVRFFHNVVKLVRARHLRQEPLIDPTKPAVFVLAPNPGEAVSAKRVPMLNNGLTQVTGRLWWINAAAKSGHYVDINCEDDDALFQQITDELQLGSLPTIIFDPRVPGGQIRHYESGLSFLDDCTELPLGGEEVTLAKIFDAIDRLYSKALVTPETAGLWKDSAKYWPRKDAEKQIQRLLHAALLFKFSQCDVRPEQSLVTGRLDLLLFEFDPLDTTLIRNHAVLELKVLRSFSERGKSYPTEEVDEAVLKGVRQAASYRDEVGAASAALCCFDMRKNYTADTCFDLVREEAIVSRVVLRLWFLFSNAMAYRDQLAAQRLSSR